MFSFVIKANDFFVKLVEGRAWLKLNGYSFRVGLDRERVTVFIEFSLNLFI